MAHNSWFSLSADCGESLGESQLITVSLNGSLAPIAELE